MTGEDIALVVLLAVLVVVAAILACLEAALGRVSPPAARALAEEHRRGAPRLVALMEERARPLNLLLLLRTLAETGALVAATVFVVRQEGEGFASFGIAVGGMTVVSYVVIGVIARTLGQQHARRIALASAGPVAALTALFGPLPRLLIALGNAVTPGRGLREGPFASEGELRALVELAEQRGVVDERERQLIDSVFDLGETVVREVMVPRPDMVVIERGKTVRQATSLCLRSGFSRLPVVGESEDDVVGVVFLKDLAAKALSSSRKTWHVEDLMRPASFVPDSKPVDELLREMQAGRVHLAVVVDEYGGTAGLVTIEDILEEIVGEIIDESDRAETLVTELGAGSWRVTARLPVDELEELTGAELDRDDVETVGGLLQAALGRVPIPGAAVEIASGAVSVRLEAESTTGRRNRIGTVLVTRREAL
ncbi:MAG TPA: hemolysin family protein [Mycobacteriales bacterium]